MASVLRTKVSEKKRSKRPPPVLGPYCLQTEVVRNQKKRGGANHRGLYQGKEKGKGGKKKRDQPRHRSRDQAFLKVRRFHPLLTGFCLEPCVCVCVCVFVCVRGEGGGGYTGLCVCVCLRIHTCMCVFVCVHACTHPRA
jgi:hypothetical protein